MESFVAYEVFSGKKLIWEQWCVRQREENENVAQYTRQPEMADGGQIVQRQELCISDELCYYNLVPDTLKLFPVIWNTDMV